MAEIADTRLSRMDRFNVCEAVIQAAATKLFDFLDDQANLSSHMRQPSAMTLGSTMDISDGAR